MVHVELEPLRAGPRVLGRRDVEGDRRHRRAVAEVQPHQRREEVAAQRVRDALGVRRKELCHRTQVDFTERAGAAVAGITHQRAAEDGLRHLAVAELDQLLVDLVVLRLDDLQVGHVRDDRCDRRGHRLQRLFERLHVLVIRAAVVLRVAPRGVLADAQAAPGPLRERDPVAHGPSLERGVPDERATESFARRVRPEDARRVDEELAARELCGVVAGHAGEAREARVTRRRVVDVEPPVALVGPREAPRVDRVDVARKQVAAVARVDDLRRRAPVVDRREQRLHRRAKAHRERASLDLERLDGVLAEPQRAGAFALGRRRRETDLELRA